MNQLNENELLNFIKLATTPYQTVEEGVKILKSAGFTELSMRERWNLQKGSSYFVVPYATSLYAFTVGAQWTEGQNMRIAAAHTDQPGFRVKPCADMVYRDYLKLDTEVYGGPILNTWMDRPLSIAGRVALRSDDPFHPLMRTIDMKKPVLTIPNMAIHINRDVNKGFELNKQTDTLPLFAMKPSDDSKNSQLESGEGTKDFFINYLAESLSIKQTDILNYDLYIYNAEEGCFLGMNGEFISGPRLDNLTSVFALLKGITEGRRSSGINLIALYDNEEIGSRSKQGADSAFLNMLLKKVYIGLNCSKGDELYHAAADSMLLSVDVAQGVHPNRPEKYDPNNQAFLNQGLTIKIDSNHKYVYDADAIAVVQQICEKAGIKYQKFVNRSDMQGGTTLGPIISSWLPMKAVDLGVPLLAMHSARETMGVKDQEYLEHLIKEFFQLEDA